MPKRENSYDCSQCPGYCCSYPLIEVSRADIARLAKHFELDYDTAEQRFTRYDAAEKVRGLRQREDHYFGTACRFLDPVARRCTVYEARPSACRAILTARPAATGNFSGSSASCRTTKNSSP